MKSWCLVQSAKVMMVCSPCSPKCSPMFMPFVDPVTHVSPVDRGGAWADYGRVDVSKLICKKKKKNK